LQGKEEDVEKTHNIVNNFADDIFFNTIHTRLENENEYENENENENDNENRFFMTCLEWYVLMRT
jgi:hypothetical protein